jgi:hypothetical protein
MDRTGVMVLLLTVFLLPAAVGWTPWAPISSTQSLRKPVGCRTEYAALSGAFAVWSRTLWRPAAQLRSASNRASVRVAASQAAAEPYSEMEIYLMHYVGVKKDELPLLMNSKPFPNLRKKSLDEDVRPCIEFLLKEVGMPRRSLSKALITCPQLLGVGLPSLRAGLDFLSELGIPRARITRVVERFPHILKYSVEANLRPSADFLQRELGISQRDLALVVEREPACLQLNVERKLVPNCSFLMQEAGLTSKQLGMIVCKNPRVLCMSVRNTMEPKLEWLKGVGVEQSKLARLLLSFPLLLSYSIPKLREGEEVLVDRLHVSRIDLPQVISKCPQLLGLSARKIEENAVYLRTRLGLTHVQVLLATPVLHATHCLGCDTCLTCLSPQPSTFNPQPSILHPSTLNPKPQTLIPNP